MKKTPEVELAQLKQALADLAEGLDHMGFVYLHAAQTSPLKEYLLGCERVAGDQAETLRRLTAEVAKLPADAGADTIRAAVVRVLQSAGDRRKSDEDLAAATVAKLRAQILQ
jgi:hypothetical protein